MEVMKKFGQHASEVQFVMKRSDQHQLSIIDKLPNQSTESTNSEVEDSFNNDKQQPAMSSMASSSGAASASKKAKNALMPKNPNISDVTMSPVQQMAQDGKNKSTMEMTSQSFHDSSSGNNLMNNRPKCPPPYNEAIAKSSMLNNNSGSLPMNHFMDSQPFPKQQSQLNSPLDINHQSLHSNNNNELQNENSINYQPTYGYSPDKRSELHQQRELTPNAKKVLNERVQLTKESKVERDEQWQRDAIKLINMQKETMTAQRKELMELDSQLNYWDRKWKTEEEKMAELDNDLRYLEKVWIEQDSQLVKLDELKLGEAIEELKKKNHQVETEKTEVTLKINEADSQIAACRKKIQDLMDEMQGIQ